MAADSQTTCFEMPDGATILIVDHDPSLRRSLRRMLEMEGTSVVEAVDGEQALRVIEGDGEDQLLDVVLTSLVLPLMSGPELIAVLLECRVALPVVAMSGSLEVPADFPTVPLLRKPFDHEELVRTVTPLILSSQANRRRARHARADAAEARTLAERTDDLSQEIVLRTPRGYDLNSDRPPG